MRLRAAFDALRTFPAPNALNTHAGARLHGLRHWLMLRAEFERVIPDAEGDRPPFIHLPAMRIADCGDQMRSNNLLAAAAIAAACFVAGAAHAGVIPGPALTLDGVNWTTTGIGFQALDNATLTSFVYQNQGQADTIVLTDSAGDILDSVATPAGTPSDLVSVNWSLSAGHQYWLLQTAISNELYAVYGGPLPSDSDIAITQSGTFDTDIAGAVSNSRDWGANEYWAAFNNITTSAVPEPAAWAMMLLGLGCLGLVLRSRRQLHGATVPA